MFNSLSQIDQGSMFQTLLVNCLERDKTHIEARINELNIISVVSECAEKKNKGNRMRK